MNPLSVRLHYVLRIASAMCFIGHGAFGIITKQIWCNYFAVFGIGEALAYQLMPVVGIVDILLGITLIAYPTRIAFAWLVFWGLFTAMLRPLSGESFGEVLERAGNYGAPLIFLLTVGVKGVALKDWFKKIAPTSISDEAQWKLIAKCLQVTGFLLLLGHGWLNVIGKAGLLKQYASLGFADPLQIAHIVGYAEVGAAVLILLKPLRQLVLLFFIWKMASELFYPSYEIFEWIERGGSYGVLLALWMILYNQYRSADSSLVKSTTAITS